jgi:hypothetical protein
MQVPTENALFHGHLGPSAWSSCLRCLISCGARLGQGNNIEISSTTSFRTLTGKAPRLYVPDGILHLQFFRNISVPEKVAFPVCKHFANQSLECSIPRFWITSDALASSRCACQYGKTIGLGSNCSDALASDLHAGSPTRWRMFLSIMYRIQIHGMARSYPKNRML